jgi:hypothetical protein
VINGLCKTKPGAAGRRRPGFGIALLGSKRTRRSSGGVAMSSRLLLSGVLTAPIVRRNRRDDGRLFGVAFVNDDVQGQPRAWTVFVNIGELIDAFERLKVGEPLAISGPFTVKIEGERTVYRITADAILGARKQRKKRNKTEATIDPDDAPKEENQKEWISDAIPF